MNIFEFRDDLIAQYEGYIKSFMQLQDARIAAKVEAGLAEGVFYPDPLIQLNPSFARGESLDWLVREGVLHPECERIFRREKGGGGLGGGQVLQLHRHQVAAIEEAAARRNYVLTTGTGSGKSLAYMIPIVDRVLREGTGKGIRAIVVYPMNALANSQEGELEKYLGSPGEALVSYARYTGQEDRETRDRILRSPPDILLTNFVMLDLLLTRPFEQKIIESAQGLSFLVLDELHTYRGRQGADVSLLVRRLRNRLAAKDLLCIGTSATIAGGGGFASQREEVARVATTIFGTEVRPESVILETLERATTGEPATEELRQRVREVATGGSFPTDYVAFVGDPLVAWIERQLGLEEWEGRLVRRRPSRITGADGAAARLAHELGLSPEECQRALQLALLAGAECGRHPVTGAAPLSFRLHQFISRGETIHATLEDEATRYLTLFGQYYRPGSRQHLLLPLTFCRECGQEYYSVTRVFGKRGEPDRFKARATSDQGREEGVSQPGFLYFSSTKPFPIDRREMVNRVPEEWLLEGGQINPEREADLPQPVMVGTDGRVGGEGLTYSYFTSPFRFCLSCGVSWSYRQRNDFSKVTGLGSEGRSTATTITNLAAIRRLRQEPLPASARKLLTFTDNRQDASLQAGHFNDFLETTLIRVALRQALAAAGEAGIGHEDLPRRVFEALRLTPQQYSLYPDEKFQNKKDTEIALLNLLGYRLYRDLERGWRITLPNLEQCGLLRIEYQVLTELCEEEEEWVSLHPALQGAPPATRQRIAEVLLDHLRRELAIDVRYLEAGEQDRISSQSYQRLKAPWAIGDEPMRKASILFPGPRRPGDTEFNRYLSSRSGFGQYLRRPRTLGWEGPRLTTMETQQIIEELLRVLHRAGLLHQVVEERKDQPPGYQLNAAVMRWKAGSGQQPFPDPIRMPTPPAAGGRTNSYFVGFYQGDLQDLPGLEAREHTAQVPNGLREEREQAFREGSLPILYCSPTMELGVDIADLNIVNLRNVPPTPANYAQRSGRAGRSGQPALVFTYCTTGSPHDQYFFKRPELMVAGQVTPPRLDLANEDLVRSHVQAIWLAETQRSLGTSLVELVESGGDPPSLELNQGVQEQIQSEPARQRAAGRAREVLQTIQPQLAEAGWYTEAWLDEVIRQAPAAFDRTLDRWRELIRAAQHEQERQSRVLRDASATAKQQNLAKQARALAESQLNLLKKADRNTQSDFYSYRYFASEGFLPGYSFPRLPISAFVPARRHQRDNHEYLSRPRFLAISEFGPRAVIYHEGSRYVINKVMLPVGEEEVGHGRIKLCGACGYLHEVREGNGVDLCERCHEPLRGVLDSLFRMQNVSTKRRDRITSDEEERLRYGYEIVTGVRFAEGEKTPTAEVIAGENQLARLTYGQAATVWRINKGWMRRKQRERLGFLLDLERGYWKTEKDDPEELLNDDSNDSDSVRVRRVIPYVDDRRNCLLFTPTSPFSLVEMASLQAALKSAIQLCYQLEDDDLAVEPLPTSEDRRQLLFYESAEGGAGVLHRLVREPEALRQVAAKALELCHFDAEGTDLHLAPGGRETCEAACYDCLLSYYNQREHAIVDRHSIREILQQLAGVEVRVSPRGTTREEHLRQLVQRADSSLEREWLQFLEDRGYRLPSVAQPWIEGAKTRPDFLYEAESTAIYIDGPTHLFPEARQKDRQQERDLEDLGYSIVRFPAGGDWESIVRESPGVFGEGEARLTSSPLPVEPAPGPSDLAIAARGVELDLDLFDERWHDLLCQLQEAIPGLQIEPGGDVVAKGRVVGSYIAEVAANGFRIQLIEKGTEHAVRKSISSNCFSLAVDPEVVPQLIELIRRTIEL